MALYFWILENDDVTCKAKNNTLLDFFITIPLTSISQIDVSFLCVCPVIDHEFRHHFVKVAMDPRGDSRVDPQTTLTML